MNEEDIKNERYPTGSKYQPYYSYMNTYDSDRDESPTSSLSHLSPSPSFKDGEYTSMAAQSVKYDPYPPRDSHYSDYGSHPYSGRPAYYENYQKNTDLRPFPPNPNRDTEKQKKKKGWLSRNKFIVFPVLFLLVVVGIVFVAAFFVEDIKTGPKIAVIQIHGTIATGDLPYGSGYAGSDTVCRLIRQAVDTDHADAIILRVNSGGGSGAAADEINFELKRAKEKGIPVISTIGDAGASAAYWIASQSNYIFVTNSTITGSIGAIGIHEDHSEELKENGVNVTAFKSGPFKDMGAQYRPLTDEEKEYWQSIVDNMKNNMVREVSAGRNLDESYIQTLADGRIYTGQKAVELGLVDGIGNFYTSVEKAQELLNNYEEPEIIYMDRISISSLLFGFESSDESVLSERTADILANPKNPTQVQMVF